MRLGGQTITVINLGAPTGYDGVGDPIYDSPTLTTVTGCSVQEHRTTRDISTTDVVIARYRIFTPFTAPLTSTSLVVIGVATWQLVNNEVVYLVNGQPTTLFLVDGEPAVWAGFNGRPHHIECYIRGQAG